MTAAVQRADLKDWGVESYRATAFLDPAKAPPQGGSWERLTGQPPDDIQQQPRAGVLVEQGMLEAALMTVAWQPGRVDLTLAHHPASGSVPSVIGAYPALDDDFRRMAEALLSSLSDRALRVAFGLVMRLPAADQLGAYAQLEPYLSRVVKFALDGSVTSLVYQTTRVRPSKTAEGAYTINRFSKWYTIYDLQMSVTPGGGMAAFPTAFATRMELDMSTDAQRTTPIPPEHLLPLFTELREAALEIAREGDVP
jgi:hypothetical protein